jgi:DNA-binding transcriptional MerR regulator
MAALIRDGKNAEAQASESMDVAALVRGHWVTCVGRLASMSREQFVDVIETLGGKYTNAVGGIGADVSLVVIGQADWPLNRSGQVRPFLRQARVRKLRDGYRFTVLSERLFLEGVGRRADAESTHRLYTISTITDLLGVTRNQIRAWARGGLIEPVRVDGGVWYFDFRQVSAASTICDLISRGITPGAIRRQLKRLQGWLPDVEQPLAQLAAIEAGGELLIRLAKGELAAGDGQLQLEFEHGGDDEQSAPVTLKLATGPTTASEWHEMAIGQEQDGYLAEAVASYRDALLAGGPDVQIVFDLAHALQQLGRRDEALERYRQTVEMAPAFVDAWNNLGVLLAEAELLEEACECFRRALAADPGIAMAHYNLADTLTDMGRDAEAVSTGKHIFKLTLRASAPRTRVGTSRDVDGFVI